MKTWMRNREIVLMTVKANGYPCGPVGQQRPGQQVPKAGAASSLPWGPRVCAPCTTSVRRSWDASSGDLQSHRTGQMKPEQ